MLCWQYHTECLVLFHLQLYITYKQNNGITKSKYIPSKSRIFSISGKIYSHLHMSKVYSIIFERHWKMWFAPRKTSEKLVRIYTRSETRSNSSVLTPGSRNKNRTNSMSLEYEWSYQIEHCSCYTVVLCTCMRIFLYTSTPTQVKCRVKSLKRSRTLREILLASKFCSRVKMWCNLWSASRRVSARSYCLK